MNIRKSAIPVRPKPQAAAIKRTIVQTRKLTGARSPHRAQSCPQYNAAQSTSTTTSGSNRASVAMGPIMKRNVKKSVASARSRRTMAAVMSVLFTATGLIDVIIPPHRARAEREPRKRLYCNDLLRSVRVTRLTAALVEPPIAQPDHLIERRRAVPACLHALDESSGHAVVACPAQF